MLTDDFARRLALAPHQSFIVQAPAGSGKTALLVRRFLTLLTVVDRPESIVAMTFTRKAAAEMKERIQKLLLVGEDDLAQAALARDRQLHWGLLDDPNRLQIQTIDSLCATLVRQMPLVSESGGIGQVVEDASDLYRLAVRRMLQSLTEGGEDARALFVRASLFFDNDMGSLESKLAGLLEKRDQWLSHPLSSHSAVVDDFRALLHLAHQELRQVFRLRSVVDFTEITRAAITALGPPEHPSDLLYSLDYRIQHLLVDEFQDTSRAQYDLLESLVGQWSDGDGRTLFVVGDPTQSIYRFRAAEVSLFLRAWQNEQLGAVRLTPIRLTTNFRSTPELVQWVNTALGPVLDHDDPVEGAVKLQPSEAVRDPAHAPPELVALLEDSGEEEARRIVQIIESSRNTGGIAILVRSRAHVERILPALRGAGIRYEATEIDPLKDQQHVLDVLSLTRALLHPADRVSWLACLRAPWCGLTLHDLSSLSEAQPARTILDLLTDRTVLHTLVPDGRERAIRFAEVILPALDQLGRLSLRELVEQTWFALGGPSLLQHANQRADVETFLDLVDRFEEGGIIRDFSLLNARVEMLYARPDTGADCVRVMTIHAAKGLEFDTVILPQLARQTRISESEMLLALETPNSDGTVNLRVAAQSQRGEEQSREYQAIKDAIKVLERHEDHRLLYVACTRAINRLYLFGSARPNKARTDLCVPSGGTFLRMLWTRYESEFQSLLRRQAPKQSSLFPSPIQSRRTTLRRASLSFHPPLAAPSFQLQPGLERSTASARTITYEWVSGTGRHIGTVVHGALKRMASEGADRWSLARLQGLRPLFDSELSRLGVSPSDRSHAVRQVLRALSNTLESERGRWILSPHPSAQVEMPIQGRIGNTLITGTVDRLFRDDGTLWIIDFKTSEHQGANLERFMNEEQRRYRQQMQNYGTLLSRIMPGAIRLGLYFPLLNAWREWAFEETAVAAGNQDVLA